MQGVIPEGHIEITAPNDDGFGGLVVSIPSSFATACHPNDADVHARKAHGNFGSAFLGQAAEYVREIDS